MNSHTGKQTGAREIRVDACKYDGAVHRSWNCRLLSETAEMFVFEGVFEREIKHPLLGTILNGTVSVEYYWKQRWYNVFKFYEPDRVFRNYYCNVNTPPILNGDVLTYTDLDIDVLVQPNFAYQILDADEFAENAEKHRYPPRVIAQAQTALAEIIELIAQRRFPFVGEQQQYQSNHSSIYHNE